ncbi:glycosyltransferase family 2 protein [Faecalicatena contorta]
MKDIGKYLECYTYDVSVIIVNYNGKRYIDTLFESLKRVKHVDFSFEVVFVDNNSSDDSVEYLRSLLPDMPFRVKIVESRKNMGFAGGNNRGVAASRGEFTVLLNSDTAVEPDWLGELFHAIKDRSCVSMVNSKLLFFYDFVKVSFNSGSKVRISDRVMLNGEPYSIEDKYCKNIQRDGKTIKCREQTLIYLPIYKKDEDLSIELDIVKANVKEIWVGDRKCSIEDGSVKTVMTAEELESCKKALIQNAGSGINEAFDGYDIGSGDEDGEKYNQPYEINNACGASLIMRRDEFIRAGMFDSRFFMYYEDTDLSYRMKLGKRKIMYCPTSVVRHIHTGSSTEWSPLFTYHVYRNKLLFVYKNISKIQYLRSFLQLYRQGKRENNLYKMCGCKDSLKIIMKLKKNTTFRW